jgi:hypothetical protein
VRSLNTAASDGPTEVLLETSVSNSGDHRVRLPLAVPTPMANWSAVFTVPACTVDALVERGEVDLDRLGLVWIDTQGTRRNVLAGAQRLVECNIPVIIEYWPYGLRYAGGLEWLNSIVRECYSHFIDIGSPGARCSASDITMLHRDFDGPFTSTDLLLLKD